MPEIAEVETVRRTLKQNILNKKITNVSVFYNPIVTNDIEEFKRILIGRKFIDIDRKGKWLLFDLHDYYLLSHLRMEGKYFLKPKKDEVLKHEHVVIDFEDDTTLRYHDTRKFGRMILVKKEELMNLENISKLGIEPIDENLTKQYLYEKLKSRNIPIKTLLLDQTIISGLGNIYANEVLFAAHIHPLKKGSELTIKDCENIASSSKKIIENAILAGGTTIKSYTSSLGVTGRFQQNLMVHKKDSKPCKICNTPIEMIRVGGRSTYYCPKCQK